MEVLGFGFFRRNLKPEKKVRLLIDAGADVNARDLDGRTPAYWAIRGTSDKALEFLKLLLEAGADLQVRCNAGMSLFRLAAGNSKVRKFLVEQSGLSLDCMIRAEYFTQSYY